MPVLTSGQIQPISLGERFQQYLLVKSHHQWRNWRFEPGGQSLSEESPLVTVGGPLVTVGGPRVTVGGPLVTVGGPPAKTL